MACDGSLTDDEMSQLREEGFLLIDGSVGEGGGQVLRISIALAAILGKFVVNTLKEKSSNTKSIIKKGNDIQDQTQSIQARNESATFRRNKISFKTS